MFKKIIASLLFLSSLNSFALTSDEEFQERISACKVVGAEIFIIADALYENDFKEKWLDIENPTEEQREIYEKYYENATTQMADELSRYCE